MKNLILALAALTIATSANAALLLDRGVIGTGITETEGFWSNEVSIQNFADSFVLANNSTVTMFRIYTARNPNDIPANGNALVRLYDDVAGNPGTLLNSETVAFTNPTLVGNFTGSTFGSVQDIYSYDFVLTNPLNLTGGVTFWMGAAGVGFDLGQAGTNGWDNNNMAQFNGASFAFHTGSGVGDQAFQLYGDAVPEPATIAILGAGALALARRRKKA